MIFESTYTPLHLPGDTATLLDLILDYPVSHRTSEPLLFPPPGLVSSSKLRSLSLDDVRIKAFKLAHGLVEGLFDQRSLQAGERVMMFSTNSHDYIASVLGICLAGGVAVLCDSDVSADTLANRIEATKAKYIIASSGGLSMKSAGGSAFIHSTKKGEGDSCLAKAESAITLLRTKLRDTLADENDRQADKPMIVVVNEDYERSLEMRYGKRGESKELKSRRNSIKGNDLAVLCFSPDNRQTSKEIGFSHSNLTAAVIQMTFALHDRFNKPLIDGIEYDPVRLNGWYGSAEKRGLSLNAQQSFKDLFGRRLPVDPDPSDHKALDRRQQRQDGLSLRKPTGKSRERIESRPEGQQEFHIDYHPQWKPFGLLLSLVALHTCTPRLMLPYFDADVFRQGISDHGATFAVMQLETTNKLFKISRSVTGELGTFWRIAIAREEVHDIFMQETNLRQRILCSIPYLPEGMTSIVSVQTLRDTSRSPSSVGKLVPNTKAIILDKAGSLLLTGELTANLSYDEWGVLLLHGPQMQHYCSEGASNVIPRSYYSAEDKTEEKWHRTGDLAKIDEEGNLFVKSRAEADNKSAIDTIEKGENSEKNIDLDFEFELIGPADWSSSSDLEELNSMDRAN